jgi:hypothetical protein
VSPVTHVLTGWILANSASLRRRERALVTLAGVVPDIDGLGIVAEYLTRNSRHRLEWFSTCHHSLHSLAFAVVVATVTFTLATQRGKTASLAFLSFHIHLLEDLVGSRGPDRYQWPIPYLTPFSRGLRTDLARTMDAECLAQFCHRDFAVAPDVFGSESRCRRFILEALFGASFGLRPAWTGEGARPHTFIPAVLGTGLSDSRILERPSSNLCCPGTATLLR